MNRSQSDDPISASLSASHDAVNAGHVKTRARLLDSLPDTIPTHAEARQAAASWRYVVGGLGLSAVAAAVLMAFWLLGPTSSAVAMERMAKALDQVSTYSFRMESLRISEEQQGRTARQVQVGRMRTEPVGLHARVQIVETVGTNTAAPSEPRTLVDLEETHQAGGRGIIIDHLKNEYWRIDEEFTADSLPGASSQVLIYKVRQRLGRVLRDLGEETIEGRRARGLEIVLDDTEPASDLGPTSAEAGDWRNVNVEVWVDPQTDLPIEFRYVRRGNDFETTFRFTDLKWNVEFAVDVFNALAPAGYTELDKGKEE